MPLSFCQLCINIFNITTKATCYMIIQCSYFIQEIVWKFPICPSCLNVSKKRLDCISII